MTDNMTDQKYGGTMQVLLWAKQCRGKPQI